MREYMDGERETRRRVGTTRVITKEVQRGIRRYPRKAYDRERAGDPDKNGDDEH